MYVYVFEVIALYIYIDDLMCVLRASYLPMFTTIYMIIYILLHNLQGAANPTTRDVAAKVQALRRL